MTSHVYVGCNPFKSAADTSKHLIDQKERILLIDFINKKML